MDAPPAIPIVLRTFRDYGPDFGWFAHCLVCFRDRTFSDADIAHLFGLDADVDDATAPALRALWAAENSALSVLPGRHARSRDTRVPIDTSPPAGGPDNARGAVRAPSRGAAEQAPHHLPSRPPPPVRSRAMRTTRCTPPPSRPSLAMTSISRRRRAALAGPRSASMNS